LAYEKRLRTLQSAGEFLALLVDIFRTMFGLRSIAAENRISPQLSEKLMLAVTGVNECLYCSYLHTRTALEKGVPPDLIEELLAGNVSGISPEELPAVLYAQHFASTGGAVSDEARRTVVERYGEDMVRHMEGFIKIVHFGNLTSNTVYAFENRLLEGAQRRRALPVYILSKPVAARIRRRGATPSGPGR
jgi:AhpD family alkylhydroperoxidase